MNGQSLYNKQTSVSLELLLQVTLKLFCIQKHCKLWEPQAEEDSRQENFQSGKGISEFRNRECMQEKLKLSDRYRWMSVLRLELDVFWLSLFFILSSNLSITNRFQYLQQYNWENKLDVCVTKSHSQNIQPKGWV